MILPSLCTVHERYLTLTRVARDHFGGSLGGKLLLCRGFAEVGIADSLAGVLAGASVLCVDGDLDRGVLREALRAGLCDFVVGHLDEALRILKNELRQKRAVSVGLDALPETCLPQMADRGLQPDLLSASPDAPGLELFLERGAVPLSRLTAPRDWDSLPCRVTWNAAEDRQRIMPLLTRIAAAALDNSHADTPARTRWLEASPRVLGRAFGGGQCLRMTEIEADRFFASAAEGVPVAVVTRDCRVA